MKELKIPYESRKVHFNSHANHNFFPMNGLAGVVKKNSTMSREAANGGIENSLWITKGTLQFPCTSQFFTMHGLAGVVEKKIHHERRSREWWILKSIMSGEAANDGFFFSPQLLSHAWWKIVTRMGIAMYLEWWIENFSRCKFQKWLDPHSY